MTTSGVSLCTEVALESFACSYLGAARPSVPCLEAATHRFIYPEPYAPRVQGRHGDKQEPYTLSTPEQLIDDFPTEVRRLRGEE